MSSCDRIQNKARGRSEMRIRVREFGKPLCRIPERVGDESAFNGSKWHLLESPHLQTGFKSTDSTGTLRPLTRPSAYTRPLSACTFALDLRSCAQVAS